MLALGVMGGAIGIAGGTAGAATKTETATGVIKAVNTKTDRLTVTVDKKSKSYKDKAATKVTLNGATSTFADLKVGDTVTLTYTVAGKAWTAADIVATS